MGAVMGVAKAVLLGLESISFGTHRKHAKPFGSRWLFGFHVI
jgi:hypothetical protein